MHLARPKGDRLFINHRHLDPLRVVDALGKNPHLCRQPLDNICVFLAGELHLESNRLLGPASAFREAREQPDAQPQPKDVWQPHDEMRSRRGVVA